MRFPFKTGRRVTSCGGKICAVKIPQDLRATGVEICKPAPLVLKRRNVASPRRRVPDRAGAVSSGILLVLLK